MKLKNKLLLAAMTVGSVSLSHGALVAVANGDFESGVVYNISGENDSTVGSSPAGTDWYESDTLSFNENITNSSDAVFGAQFEPNGNILVMNNTDRYIYQLLGTLGAEVSATISFDGIERVQNNGDFTVSVAFYASNTFTGANGTDIAGAGGVTALGSQNVNFVSDATLGGADSLQSLSTGELDLTGATGGDEIWVRIGTTTAPALGDSTLNIDNVTVSYTTVPEPSSTALLGFGVFALILRRKR